MARRGSGCVGRREGLVAAEQRLQACDEIAAQRFGLPNDHRLSLAKQPPAQLPTVGHGRRQPETPSMRSRLWSPESGDSTRIRPSSSDTQASSPSAWSLPKCTAALSK